MRPEDQQIRVETNTATPMRGFVASLTRLEHASDLQFIQPRRDASPEVLLQQALADPIVLQDVTTLRQSMPGTAGERLGLALLASQMTGEQFGSVLHSMGRITLSASRGDLCPETERLTNIALQENVDGLLLGMSAEGRPMMAVKAFPGRAAATFFQPVAFEQGVAVPGVWYEVEDDATRTAIRKQSAAGDPRVQLLPETRLALMRAVRDPEFSWLETQLSEYQERVLAHGLLPEVPDPFNAQEQLDRDTARVIYNLRHSDDR